MSTDIWLLGGHQTDFARNLTREGLDMADLVHEVVTGTLADAQVDARDVQTVHVGSACSELYTGQGHLAGLPSTVEPDLWGTMATRHEAACASGGVSILAAMAQIESGRADVALVLGVEIERSLSGDAASETLNAASWVGHEETDARFVWPWVFHRLAEIYDERYSVDHGHLAAMAEMAFRNARSNPLAQTRSWQHGERAFSQDDDANPVVHGRVRRNDSSQITDGGAGTVLAGRAFAEGWAARRGLDLAEVPRLLGWGHRTVGLGFEDKVRRDGTAEYAFPHVRQAAVDAQTRAGLAGTDGIDCFEVHDCFTATGYMLVDHLGLTKPGEARELIDAGALERDGARPLNPGGGLMGQGHPVGATGVRMVVDARRQITRTAGEVQVDADVRRVATLNIGGSTASTVSFVVGLS